MWARTAAVRDGDWKLVRPLIRGTRFFREELCVSDEDWRRTAAFIEADMRHKENPLSVRSVFPVPRLRPQRPEPPELYDLGQDPGEQHDLAAEHPDRVRRMLGQLEDWFEAVEADRGSIDWSENG